LFVIFQALGCKWYLCSCTSELSITAASSAARIEEARSNDIACLGIEAGDGNRREKVEWPKSNGHQAYRLEPAQPRAAANSQEQSLYSFVLPLLLGIHHRRQLLAILAILAILAVLTLRSSAPATQPLLHIEQSALKLDAIGVSILV
jgi:hypothetical protein